MISSFYLRSFVSIRGSFTFSVTSDYRSVACFLEGPAAFGLLGVTFFVHVSPGVPIHST